MDKEKTFPYIPFYRNWYESISEMQDAERLATYDALYNFAFNGVEPPADLPTVSRVFVTAVKGNIEKSVKRYYDGQKGGNTKGASKQRFNDEHGIITVSETGYLQFTSTEQAEAFRDKYNTSNYYELPKSVQKKIK